VRAGKTSAKPYLEVKKGKELSDAIGERDEGKALKRNANT
jgi:hypothetical protein